VRPFWDFGDATAYEFGTSATHVYTKPGTYKVRLYACDQVARGFAEKTIVVR
jgi:PKD repeat protein